MTFRRSDGTVGVEYELQLVDASTFEPLDGALPLLEFFRQTRHVKPEFLQNAVEVTTPICRSMDAVERALRQRLIEIREVAGQLGMELCGGGTHPFSRRLGTVTPLSRYQAMAARTGILGQLKGTFALQVHVGVGSARQAVAAMQDVRACLPLLIALSASSPFWFGYDSGHASWRQRILASDRTYGIPPHFRRWRDVEGFFDTAHRAGILSSWRDIHWDLRPRPDFGTVEIRVMDAPPTLSESTAIAAFARALTVYLLRTPASQRPPLLPRVLPRWLEIENHFQAARLALDAEYVDASGAVRPLRDILDATLEAISATGDELGDGDYLAQLHPRVTRDPSHARQRRVYRETGSTRAVVADLAHQFSVDLDRAPHRPVYSISSTRTSPSSVSTMPMPGQ